MGRTGVLAGQWEVSVDGEKRMETVARGKERGSKRAPPDRMLACWETFFDFSTSFINTHWIS